jgi:hypothetical protein
MQVSKLLEPKNIKRIPKLKSLVRIYVFVGEA